MPIEKGDYKMKVFVIRHGESENNLNKLWTGWQDAELTAKGIEDAKKAGEYLRGISFDKIYSSDLKRAQDTAKNAIPNCIYETNMSLREVNIGSIAGTPLASIPMEQKDNISLVGYTEFGGESKGEFEKRVSDFMKELEKSDYENIAVFSHAGWLRKFLKLVLETHIPAKHLCCNNCVIGVFEYIGGKWKLHSWINML